MGGWTLGVSGAITDVVKSPMNTADCTAESGDSGSQF